MNEADFTNTISKIVAECMPDEAVAFEVAGKDHIEQAFRSYVTGEAKNHSSDKIFGAKKEVTEFEFLAEAKIVIEFVGLIKGTLEFYQWFKKQFWDAKESRAYEASLTLRWKEELRKAGLSEKRAELIALKCSADVLDLLVRAK